MKIIAFLFGSFIISSYLYRGNIKDHYTMNAIVKIAEQISAELRARGIDGSFSTSETDYGCSCYFVFYANSESLDKLKIRVSDHSVGNTYRMSEERHYSHSTDTPEKIANMVELYLFPSNFQYVECTREEGATHRVGSVWGKYVRIA